MKPQTSPAYAGHPQTLTLAQWLARLSEYLPDRTVETRWRAVLAAYHSGLDPAAVPCCLSER